MTHRPEDRDRIEALLTARNGGPGAPSALFAGIDSEAVYGVQAGVMERIGPAGAFKIARRPGTPVIMAPIPQSDIHASPAVLPAQGFRMIGVELEIAFRVCAALPAPDDPDFARRAADCVAMLAVLEIVDSRLAAPQEASALAKLADNQSAGALVIGRERRDWQAVGPAPHTHLRLGGEVLLDAPAAPPGGDAFETFCVLARMIGLHCGGLQPGRIVITGSLNGLPLASPGDRAEGRIEGLSPVSAHFAD